MNSCGKQQKRFRVQVTPACMGTVAILCQLLGSDNVDPGEWRTPCWFIADEEDVQPTMDLLQEVGDKYGIQFNFLKREV